MKRVLIFEKDKFTSEILAESVSSLGFDPLLYNPEENLLVVLRRSEPDIVIMCLGLYSGKQELYRLALKLNQKKLVVILTSNSLIEPSTLKEFNASIFLHKPYDLEELGRVLYQSVVLLNKDAKEMSC